MHRAGHGESSDSALEAARRQIAALQAQVRALMATNASLELQLSEGRNELGSSQRARQQLEARLAHLEAQLAEQAAWQARWIGLHAGPTLPSPITFPLHTSSML